jgi:monoamine oxidase
LRQILFRGRPGSKTFVIQEMPYYTRARVIFQTERASGSRRSQSELTPPDPRLNELWEQRRKYKHRAASCWRCAGGTARRIRSLRFKLYPGKSADIEQVISHDWSKDPYAGMCERISYRPGELARYWPEVTRPVGRIHFAGAYAAAMSWGQEAALESGNRAAMEIDRA